MKKYFILLPLFCWPVLATAVVHGNSNVMIEPDMLEMDIGIRALCQASSQDAQNVGDEIDSALQSLLGTELEKFFEEIPNAWNYIDIMSDGGSIDEYVEYGDPEEDSDVRKRLCTGFKNEITVTVHFKAAHLKNLSGAVKLIQNLIYKNFQSNNVPGTARTIVLASQLRTWLSAERSNLQYSQALWQAVADAMLNFKTMAAACGIKNYRLKTLSDKGNIKHYDTLSARSYEASPSGSIAIKPKKESVEANVELTFCFESDRWTLPEEPEDDDSSTTPLPHDPTIPTPDDQSK